MTYVALLRGINVGGNNKVDMKTLKQVFENAGMENVKTYINSGNVIFTNPSTDSYTLANKLEAEIEKEFGFYVKVLIKNIQEMNAINNQLPTEWRNDDKMKCDILFLWEDIDSKEIVSTLPLKPEIDTALYVNGAIIWSVDRKNVTKSGMLKIIGTDLYKKMTVRNCNTFRKLLSLMEIIT